MGGGEEDIRLSLQISRMIEYTRLRSMSSSSVATTGSCIPRSVSSRSGEEEQWKKRTSAWKKAK